MSEAAAPTFMDAYLLEWGRLAQTMTRDGTIALDRLGQARSPIDVFQVQRDWIGACLTASMEGGLRFWGACANAAAPEGATEEVFHLPD